MCVNIRTMAVDTELKKFFSLYPKFKYKKGEIILRPEEAPQGIIYIKSGYVRMYQVFEDGKELTLNIFKPGSYFPMVWAFTDSANLYYYEAFTILTTHRASKAEVINFLKTNPETLIELTNRIIFGFTYLLSNIEKLLSSSACQRINSVLVILANRFGKPLRGRGTLITLSLTHEDIARLTGLSRETTSIEMKKLMDAKCIFYKRRQIVIYNMNKLQTKSLYKG